MDKIFNNKTLDQVKLRAYIGLGAAIAGKLLAGTQIYGVVLIPATTTFLGCAAVVTIALSAHLIAFKLITQLFHTKGYLMEGVACNAAIIFYGLQTVTQLSGMHPISFLSLVIIGSLARRLCEKLQNDFIEPKFNKSFYSYLKYILPQTHITKPVKDF